MPIMEKFEKIARPLKKIENNLYDFIFFHTFDVDESKLDMMMGKGTVVENYVMH